MKGKLANMEVRINYKFQKSDEGEPIEPEVYSGSCQASKVERFAKIFNGFQLLTVFAKSSILDV